jgi:predicted ribosomally synthesized peptide with nif11-like leader
MMNNQFSPEMLEKAKSAKSAGELLIIAKENGFDLTEEQANAYFAKLNPSTGALSDEELDNVSGGCNIVWTYRTCPKCGSHNVYTAEYGGAVEDLNFCSDCSYKWRSNS